MNPSILPVILSGGCSGQLWPLARQRHPKPLLALTDDGSLLQATLARVANIDDCLPPLVLCQESIRFAVEEQMQQGGSTGLIVLEPHPRKTAPALTLAALVAEATGDDPILLLMPADHFVADPAALRGAIRQAAVHASRGAIVSLGVEPDLPETAFGYIQYGEPLDAGGASRLQRFIEKPDAAAARRYLETGNYLWHSGIVLLRASVWLRALELCHPDMLAICRHAFAGRRHEGSFLRVDHEVFSHCPADSIDYVVMERLNLGIPGMPEGVVQNLSAGWTDIGTWESLWRSLPRDEDGNATRGDVMLTRTGNTLAVSESRLVCCVGIENAIVIETEDAVLVADQRRAADVELMVARLDRIGRPEAMGHRRCARPWGSDAAVDRGEGYCVRRLRVNPGEALPLQMHMYRSTHWIVLQGLANASREGETLTLHRDQSLLVPSGTPYRIANAGQGPLELLEVQSGAYLGEDDVVRVLEAAGARAALLHG
jgi:mannose-1-phosphate guanylyltransferase/mannose-6-phosphate isomerase